MALLIALENEFGEKIENIGDTENIFQNALTKNDEEIYELLKYVDLYGNTVFNNLQMDNLIKDLNYLLKNVKNESEKEIIEAIYLLCKKCKNGVHLYIKFYGD